MLSTLFQCAWRGKSAERYTHKAEWNLSLDKDKHKHSSHLLNRVSTIQQELPRHKNTFSPCGTIIGAQENTAKGPGPVRTTCLVSEPAYGPEQWEYKDAILGTGTFMEWDWSYRRIPPALGHLTIRTIRCPTYRMFTYFRLGAKAPGVREKETRWRSELYSTFCR